MMKTIMIETQTERYPFIVGSGCIDQLSKYIPQNGSKVMIVTDEQVAKHHLTVVRSLLEEQSVPFDTFILPSGEEAKSFLWLERLLSKAIEVGLDRSSLMIALGGGVVGDVTGFAAAIYMRGIRYIQLPTTVLAHDSSIGGKVAINHPLGKNMIGSFYHPEAVIYDTQFLLTLSDRDYASGFSEMIKHAIIRDSQLFSWIEEHVDPLLNRDISTLDEALYRSSLIKVNIVNADEREANIRALLNFGHTIGQALENLYEYKWLHGEAISIGMVAAAQIAQQHLHYDLDLERIKRVLRSFHLPIDLPEQIDTDQLLDIIGRDKKTRAGKIVMVFPERIGHAVIQQDVHSEWIIDVIHQMVKE